MKARTSRQPQRLKRIIQKCCKQFSAHKLSSLDETHLFIQRHNLLKLTQEESNKLNFPTSMKLNLQFKIFQKKIPSPDDFIGEL